MDMKRNIKGPLQMSRKPNMDGTDVLETVKGLYLDWLRFFRANMCCGWACSAGCPLPDDCPEIDKVWGLWLDTLSDGHRMLFN